MDAEHLSNRLLTVSQFVPAHARLADIGSDHAYLPAYLATHQLIDFAVAGEVVKGPFENAQAELHRLGLEPVVQARLADGLAAIHPEDQLDTVVIAGMGGPLIRQILTQGAAKLRGIQRLILQPNVGAETVRDWLQLHNFEITAERILSEAGHTYEIIVAEPVAQKVHYSEKELLFGPKLLAEHSPVFVAEWQREQERAQAALAQMQQAKQLPIAHIEQTKARLALIAEVLADAR